MAELHRARKAPAKSVLPRLIDPKMVFRLDVDDLLWQEDPGLGEEECSELPLWLGDAKIRGGIVAILERDRCVEENERLDYECTAMRDWLDDELRALNAAISIHSGNHSSFIVPSFADGPTLCKEMKMKGCDINFSDASKTCAK